jgi:tetratricopeptide (TPR) repeat protein
MKTLLSCIFILAATLTSAAHTRSSKRIPLRSQCWTPQTPQPKPEVQREMEAKLSEARAQYEKNPNDADAAIWFGRRTAYLGRFDEAIHIYTDATRANPKDARLYRHRGHRFITIRCFDLAISDLKKASKLIAGKPDEIEPDGLPNARNVPLSTLHSNVWYHLGLAFYLKGDFQNALRAYREGMKFSTNPDMLSATSHWLYMTLRRLGRHEEAQKVLEGINEEMEIIENRDYHRLLLMYKGKLSPGELLEEAAKDSSTLSFASTAYGVGNWYLQAGQKEKALKVFVKIIDGQQQTSFGYIAAEVELGRMGLGNYPREKLRTKTLYE